MANNEKTSKEVAKIAAHVLATGHATQKEAQTLAGATLTQAPDHKRLAAPKKGGKKQ
jgi:hypothetical protein